MALIDYKLEEADFQQRKISDLSDTPSSDGMTAASLKAYFDYIPKTMIAMGAINSIIDLLVSSEGAANVGGSVSGVVGTTIQEILDSTKKLLDDRYTRDDTNLLLKGKADLDTVNTMIKSVGFDASTGTFTFTEAGGMVHSFNTALEKVAVNFVYNRERQAMDLTLADGSVVSIPLGEFITANEIGESNTIQPTTAGGIVMLEIKNGCITDEMMSSALLSAIQEYVMASANNASSSDASAKNAKTYADAASSSAAAAKSSASSAASNASAAQAAVSETAGAAAEAKSYARGGTGTRTGEDTDNAAYYARQAQNYAQQAENFKNEAGDIAGGDFATRAELEAKANKPNTVTTILQASGWEGNVYSFEDIYPSNLYRVSIEPNNTCTADEIGAWGMALMTGSATTNVLTALGDVPTVDIPVILTITAVSSDGGEPILETTTNDTGYYLDTGTNTYNLGNVVKDESQLDGTNYNFDIL